MQFILSRVVVAEWTCVSASQRLVASSEPQQWRFSINYQLSSNSRKARVFTQDGVIGDLSYVMAAQFDYIYDGDDHGVRQSIEVNVCSLFDESCQ
uniref:Uncharacterized protein n=1 Tax=Kalanchoe fedtschenkoi TaxID=63787 RepID=A0A7N0UNP2_KALFE